MSSTATASDLLRAIPKVDRLLADAELEPLLATYPRREVVARLRETLDDLRRGAAEGALREDELAAAAIRERLAKRLARRFRPYYRRVINATGVILHTGLGRAPLAAEAVSALTELAPYPQRLEIDLESGERGGREEGCARLLCELVGCEAATVVNNNAAATLLILAALARAKRVLLSRGEMVEIGGSYRVPEILRESGAVLAEVGTTNRTHLRDYAQALGDSRFSPRERVLRYYGELLEHFARQEKPEYHCFIGSLSFEMAELSPPIAAKVESILQASAQILQDCLEQAREGGELAADEDCASLAGFIGFAWQGALARFKVGAGLAPLNAFMSRLELLLRA